MESSSYDRVFSNQGINEIAEALGIDLSVVQQPGYDDFDEEGTEVYVEGENFDGTASGTDTSIGSDVGSEPLSVVWPIYIVQPPTIKTSAGGAKTVDIVLEFDAVDGATGYEYQIVPV